MRILCCGVERESKEQGVKDITLFTVSRCCHTDSRETRDDRAQISSLNLEEMSCLLFYILINVHYEYNIPVSSMHI